MSFALAMTVLLAMSLALVALFGINASRAPFMSVALICLVLCLAGMAGMLMAGAVLIVVLSAAACGFALWQRRGSLRALAASFVTPGIVFFVLSCILLYLVLAARAPEFCSWDEFSFWGIAAKRVHDTRALYTLVPSSMINISYPPALPLWSFFLQLFQANFSEWQVYAAYDVMLMSVMAMLFAGVRWNHVVSVMSLTAFGLVGLYLFWHSYSGMQLYSMAMADVQVGVMFSAPLVAWYVTGRDPAGRCAAALLGLVLLPLVKDVGFAYGLVAAVVIVSDMLLSGGLRRERPATLLRRVGRIGLLAVPFAAVVLSYWMWSAHFAAAVNIERVTIGYEYGIVEMLRGQDAYFNAVLAAMWQEFLSRQLVMFGPIVDMVVVFTLLPAALALFFKNRRTVLRIAAFSVLMPAGYAVYALFQAYTYAAIFQHTADVSLWSFERYMSAYPIGWAIAVVAVFCSDRWEGWRLRWGRGLTGAAVCCALLFATFYFTPVHPDQYLLTSAKVPVLRDARRAEFAHAAQRYDLPDGTRVYFASQGDDGLLWFYFNYAMQPAYVVKTIETGNFVPMDAEAVGLYDVNVDASRFSRYLRDNGVEYVFVYETDDYFVEEFARLFSDGLQGGKGMLYAVEGYGTDGLVQLTPVGDA